MGRKIDSTWTARELEMLSEMREVEDTLAHVLHYPFTDYGYAIGDHTAVTLAKEAARKLRENDSLITDIVGDMESEAIGECGKCGTLLFSEGDMCACDMFEGE